MINKYDYDMLCYISRTPNAHEHHIVNLFGPGSHARLHNLISNGIVCRTTTANEYGGHDINGCFAISDKGHMLMQDYSYNVGFSLKRLWEERYWKLVPIVISLVSLIFSILAFCSG